MPDTCQPCAATCESVFDRVVVSHVIAGYSRIMWTLLDTFTDPAPLRFQLQAGTTSSPDADDWEDVGLEVVDQYVAYDAEQRVWGKTNWTHYRVRLTTDKGVYYSLPVGGLGVLDRRSWRLAREIVRQRIVAFRHGPGGQEGYLLKRRWTGEPCDVCTDPATRESRNPDCPTCYGTGFRCGYYYPAGCVWAELDPRAYHQKLDGQQRGLTKDVVVKALMVMTDLISEEDVWVAKKTDDRYYVHAVQHTSEMRGIPLLANVELRPVQYSSPIYAIRIPDQLAALEP